MDQPVQTLVTEDTALKLKMLSEQREVSVSGLVRHIVTGYVKKELHSASPNSEELELKGLEAR